MIAHSAATAGPSQMLLVTHKRLGGQLSAESVVDASPAWNTTIGAPASWDSLKPTDVEVRRIQAPLNADMVASRDDQTFLKL